MIVLIAQLTGISDVAARPGLPEPADPPVCVQGADRVVANGTAKFVPAGPSSRPAGWRY